MKFNINVVQEVEVTLDESKFTPEFMDEFRASFFDFDTIEDHAKHIAQLYARGVVEGDDFIEGYGRPSEMGIRANALGGYEEIST